ncbi:MAG: hypothetical protein ACM3Q2_01585 [Syntrophothermus sp.]
MKNHSSKAILFLISFSTFVLGCKSTVVETVVKEPEHGRIVLSADSVEIGQKITAHFVKMEPVHIYSVMLNRKLATFRQTDDSTANLLVPYSTVGGEVGNFVFDCSYGEKSDTILVSRQVKLKIESWIGSVGIKWNTNDSITSSDTRKWDANGQLKGWTFQTSGDTITFKRQLLCHDECNTRETIAFLNNGNNVLPQFLYAVYEKNEWLKPRIYFEATSDCKVIIDKWGSNNLYSGTFSSPDFSFIFGKLN